MNNDKLFKKVKELKFPIGKYALFGSAPLGIRNLRDCNDIDIIVTKDLWNRCKKAGWKLKMKDNGDEYLIKGKIELWKSWYPGKWNIKNLIKKAEIIDSLPFVKLEYVLQWKKTISREKDLKDIKTIESFLKNKK